MASAKALMASMARAEHSKFIFVLDGDATMGARGFFLLVLVSALQYAVRFLGKQ